MKILKPTPEHLAEAAAALRAGEIVVMPTETVYGLAADATNAKAIKTLYEAKGRPETSPLIVHIASVDQLDAVGREIPEIVRILADRFWPGPLTLVIPKHPDLPAEVTGGLDTVAVRMPDHGVALALITMAGVPLAAPSANRFMQLSPTRVEHIDPLVAAKATFALDGGASSIGVESTVVDLTCDPPRLLRPGGVSRTQLQAALGVPLASAPPNGVQRSPGMNARHYAPKAELRLVDRLDPEQTGLVFGQAASRCQIRMPRDARAYAATLYDALHALDGSAPILYVERPPDEPEWETVWDRLRRASAPPLPLG